MQIELGYGLNRIKDYPQETQDKFYLKNGELNAYSFACGYIQWADYRAETNHHHARLELFQDGCFHVRLHDHENHGRIFWHSFDTLGAARRDFHKSLKGIQMLVTGTGD